MGWIGGDATRRERIDPVSAWFQAVANGVVDASTTSTDAFGATAAGWVSTTTTPMPGSMPNACSVSGATRPRIGDDEVDAPVRTEVLEHGRQPVAVVGADGGEHVDHVVARIAAGAEHLAGAGDDLDPPPEPHQPRGDRRRRFHRDLERLRRRARRAARRAPPRRAIANGLRPGGS